MKWNMQTLRISQNCLNLRHINKNSLKYNKSYDKSLILSRGRSLVRYENNKGLKQSKSDTNEPTTENNGLLSRYIESSKCNVTVWGSSVVELGVKLDNLSYLRSKNRFLRRFKNLQLTSNGSKFIPNAFQLASLRPQLTGSDLLINSPKGSGKTLMYLLPHLTTNYLYNSNRDNTTDRSNKDNNLDLKNNEVDESKDNDLNISLNGHNQRLVVLLPTIDLVVDESRTAYRCFRKSRRVASLLYKDLVLDNLKQVMDADIIYSTPKTFLKFLIKFPTVYPTIRFIVVDESERIATGEFASLLVRIRDLLPVDVQYVFLSNFTHNHLLHQFTSRFLKLNFKIISYLNHPNQSIKDSDSSKKDNNSSDFESVVLSKRVTKHIYGPIRDINDHVKIYNHINSNKIDNILDGINELKSDNNKLEDQKVVNNTDRSNKDNKDKEEQMMLEKGTENDQKLSSRIDEFNMKDRKEREDRGKIYQEIEEEIQNSKEAHEEFDNPFKGNWPVVYDLEMKIKKNMDLIMNDNRNRSNKDNKDNYKIEYVLYEPSKFVEALLSELDESKKTLVYFPTVKMCQFCYLYFKHYLKAFNRDLLDISNTTDRSNKDTEEDQFMFYDFHTGLSLDKRRFVMDNFKLASRGVLFCTNLAIGVNFNNISKIVQVSFTFNIYELLNKFQFSSYNDQNRYNNISNTTGDDNNNRVAGQSVVDNTTYRSNKDIERVLLLNNLDGHILYEYYKNDIDVVLKRTFTGSPYPSDVYSTINSLSIDSDNNISNTDRSNKDNSKDGDSKDNDSLNNRISNTNNNNLLNTFIKKQENKIPKMQLEWDVYLLSSCELMYRSLLGYYCENSQKLKLEKWIIPSFFNEFTSSFGISHNFKVSKQFASRTQLLNSPGLEISSSCNRKTDLMASLKSYPGFISKSQQSRISI